MQGQRFIQDKGSGLTRERMISRYLDILQGFTLLLEHIRPRSQIPVSNELARSTRQDQQTAHRPRLSNQLAVNPHTSGSGILRHILSCHMALAQAVPLVLFRISSRWHSVHRTGKTLSLDRDSVWLGLKVGVCSILTFHQDIDLPGRYPVSVAPILLFRSPCKASLQYISYHLKYTQYFNCQKICGYYVITNITNACMYNPYPFHHVK